jgi:hypothetical protein
VEASRVPDYFVFFVGFWSFVVFFRRKLAGIYVKLISVAVSVAAASTLLSLQGLVSPAAIGLAGTAPGAGGAYGKAFEFFLVVARLSRDRLRGIAFRIAARVLARILISLHRTSNVSCPVGLGSADVPKFTRCV